ncbi:MAG: hypothetical protein M1828_004875 [Chrysothrix sp. TS-e1954]|nr:MAG: hypothetical protein M1828_004875 [Chrysothrix sp. TS-e1954]
MLLQKLIYLLLACWASAAVLRGKPGQLVKPYKRAPLQDIVTWDEHSIFVRGQRVLFYSGEFHPFRLPVPSLWLDVFQKIKALGYNGVSFYVNWALLEGQEGHFRAEGIFALDQFFDAATQAGIYLLARPGPYINAEVSGGGFPGWLQRVPGQLRTNDTTFINATKLYQKSVSQIIAKAQITEGGPVILFQSENEYSQGNGDVLFPNHRYFADVEQMYRDNGIVLPFISNDAAPHGYFAPGTGLGAVDIYGHDGYPLGFDCANPYTWPDGALPIDYRDLHEEQSPNTPYSLIEFQGGSFDPWGGTGFGNCAELLDSTFQRVFYKNDFSFGVTVFNIYMTYGGTNWGNLGHPGGYTSYDYGAVIKEDRTVTREKYSDSKCDANFLAVSPAYLTATPENNTHANGSYTSSEALAITRVAGNVTSFFVVRHAAYNTFNTTQYKLMIPTSKGVLQIPQLQGQLTLTGRDSKIHVSDYNVGEYNLLYSTAEIFTWKATSARTVLLVYGGTNETHELALQHAPAASLTEGSGVQISNINGSTILNWQTSPTRRVVKVGNDLFVYILDRYSAYDYWVLPSSTANAFETNSSIVARAGYLLRLANVSSNSVTLGGDLNATAPLEIISGAPQGLQTLSFNGKSTQFTQDKNGVVHATLTYSKPTITLPDLGTLRWHYLDSLPEIQSNYSDSLWTSADLKKTYNTNATQMTPTSLFGGDYGYTTGTLLFRGHFVSNGQEKMLTLETQGGSAFGASVWLNSTFLGSWRGLDADSNYNSTLQLPSPLQNDQPYVFTVVIDTLGLDENGAAGDSGAKNPRGILRYSLSGREKSAVSWKITGNLGGEEYCDLVRGPKNEGGMFAERQGLHLPGAPVDSLPIRSPTDCIANAGIAFYATTFNLSLPMGYDIPLSFVFTNATSESAKPSNYRVQLFVNGYQFGKYVNNIGPQTAFPVPEGILDYRGENYVALTLWALDKGGAKLGGLKLESTAVIQGGVQVAMSPIGRWEKRLGAY